MKYIEIPTAPYNGDFVSNFTQNISNFIHDNYYRTDKVKYNELNAKLDKVLKIKDFRQQRGYLYALMHEINNSNNKTDS